MRGCVYLSRCLARLNQAQYYKAFGSKPEFFKIKVDGCFIFSQNSLSLETICMSSSIMEIHQDPGYGISSKEPSSFVNHLP